MRFGIIGMILAALVVATPAAVMAQANSPYTALNLPQGQLNRAQAMAFLTLVPIEGATYDYTYQANGTWTGVANRAGTSPQTINGTFQIAADGTITRSDGTNIRTFTLERSGNFYYRYENGERERMRAAG